MKKTRKARDARRRADCLKAGQKTYTSGIPCPDCGAWKCWVSTFRCIACFPDDDTLKRKRT